MAAVPEVSSFTENSTYELAFSVVDWSSQRPEFPASSLESSKGRWETVPSQVKNAFLTFELENGPSTVNAIECGTCDVLACPRRCRVQYCQRSSKGPWVDAWKFTVDSPAGLITFKSEVEYGQNVREFMNAVLKYCGDEAAAAKFLDVNGTGAITRDDLLQLCRQLQQVRGNPLAAAVAACNLNMVFRDLDADTAGFIRVKELLSADAKPPLAQWWRLLMLDNWGSANNIALGTPVKLFSPEIQTSRRTSSFYARRRPPSLLGESLAPLETDAPTSATPDAQNLRHLAFEHNMRYAEVEEVHNLFQRIDADGSGSICRGEFEQLIVKLYNLSDASDLPSSRSDYFWKQADKDGSGSIDFAEFLSWHILMANPPPRSAPYVEMAGKTLTGSMKSSFGIGRATKDISPIAELGMRRPFLTSMSSMTSMPSS